jgi:hypothetical protein
MMGLIGGMAFFHEAGNGANFALVPHVHPYSNGEFPFPQFSPQQTPLLGCFPRTHLP